MNRELKFRAWDIYSKPNNMVIPHAGDFIGWHSPSNWKDCYKIMQFTGVTDKNGVDIYEGDIVRFKDEVCAIIFFHAAFCIQTKQGNKCLGCYDRNLSCEVIGNICENPLVISQATDESLPERCPNCFRKAKISNIVNGKETDAYFCEHCGGLVSWIK